MLALRGIDTLSGETTLSKLFCPIPKWIYTIRKEFAPKGSKFFPYRVDPFSEGAGRMGGAVKQTGSHESCLLWRKIYHVYSVPLNK